MHSRTLLGAILLALLLGCGPKTPPPGAAGGPSGGQTISAASGGIAADAAGAQITVPPGALPKDARISLAQKASTTHASPGVLVVGSVWTFQVDGADHFTFSKPVTVAVPVDPALRKPGASVGLSVWNGERWEPVPGARLDASSSKVVAEVDHFSEYAPTQDSPLDRAKEDLYLNNEYWYGRINVSISGHGQRHGDLGFRESMTISREAELTFRLRAIPGELGMASAMEELKKHPGFALPPQAAQAMEKARGQRHWVTEMIKPGPEDRTQVHLRVSDRYSSSSPKVELGELREDAASTTETLEGTWDELVGITHALEIDLKKGTYTFSLGTMEGGSMKFHRTSTGQPDQDSEKPAGLSFQIKNQKLPDLHATLSGSYAIPPGMIDYTFKGAQITSHVKGSHLQGRVGWSLSPAPLENVDLVLSPAGYDDWLPRGGTSDGQKGDRPLAIQARLEKRGGGAATKAKMQSLTVRLKDVSNVPGVCLNVPLEKGADKFDLQFAPGNGFTVDEEGTRVIKKGSEFDHLDLKLDCYDWGAWGTLVGEAMLVDGRMLWGKLDKDRSVEEILIPKRKPDSKIADKWKKEMNAEGMNDDDDRDPQNGNAHNGDGLTVYEEYRGMIAKGKHTRDHPAGPDGFRPLSPGRKDLIVKNKATGEPSVVRGFRLLEKAAGIHIVEVDENELPESRIVNVNTRPDLSAGPQRGLVVYKENLPGDDVGLTIADLHKPAGSREQYDRVQIDFDKIRRLYKADGRLPWTVDFEMSQTVAHELAHGLDLEHHGEGRPIGIQKPSRMYIYDRSRKRVTPDPLPGAVGETQTQGSGDVRCIMCYNDVYTWGYHPAQFLFMTQITPPGTIFCTSREGTGHNADFEIDDPENPGHPKKIPGVFGQAANGPCLPKMRIKDQSK